ncbi:hypothetical protein WJX73_007738 [Symbiochloris irregularis]|uniref:Tyrosine specific protein phosphatases domain-containing protein n=1 Tax=Symbiochloris irregularis TaxID=706552 RepID=A0AAW1NTM7_9CHLO
MKSCVVETPLCSPQQSCRAKGARSLEMATYFSRINDRLPLLQLDREGFAGKHTFAPWANWLVPPRLLVGAYPSEWPGIGGQSNLEWVVRHGVNRIISLQAEMPAPPPYQAAATRIDATRSEQNRWQYGKKPMTCVHVPVQDFDVPTISQVQSLVTDMADWLCGGDVIYMHCMGGIGRTGTMCACILISLYSLPAQRALDHVQAAFDTRKGRGKSPETEAQVQFVKDWEAHWLQLREQGKVQLPSDKHLAEGGDVKAAPEFKQGRLTKKRNIASAPGGTRTRT